jgi:hypothetical protein
MINRTDAWECTDGKCFSLKDKEDAYNHEIKTLLQSLPNYCVSFEEGGGRSKEMVVICQGVQ